MPENRMVDQRHVRKLVAQIAKENLLHIKPLDVTANLGVIDGQHRLAAARLLGLPIFYRVSSELGGQHIASLNTTSKNWQALIIYITGRY
ncbi:ParB N-terminal domain-containing protein [Hymenobacter ruricola]|uniref:ParB N-terminal domain-containing protein n=1 Tax=Hymenobacter ruricola TaxID=2791023 RepID=A0ABS0I6F2_9BACT|nr:ParB N-terminal domain-containing protein [Hymenobacter ruricola]MBF9222525.1 ParB N-terminal domain-containing protein [Hymenobacter ruricola]